VDDVFLDIVAGRVAVILGRSGSGKTTLLKMVNRLIEPSAGRILLGGLPVDAMAVEDLRRRIGYVIQQTGLFPHWTVAQNIATVPRISGWSREETARRVSELMQLIGLPEAEFARRYPSQLSGGQQQRVGIARALASDPDLLLMDEPFGAADVLTRRHLQDEFIALQRRTGKTVLFVTHDVEEALRLADQLVVIEEGRVRQQGAPLDVIGRPADSHVADLVGARDSLRLLSLLGVGSIVATQGRDTAACGRAAVPLNASVRDALALLLSADRDALPVADEAGRVVGEVSLGAIRTRLRQIDPTPAYGS